MLSLGYTTTKGLVSIIEIASVTSESNTRKILCSG